MFIFLDESGDLGFDFVNKKPSQYFVITLLICPNSETVGKFKAAVRRTLKNKLNHKKTHILSRELKASLIFHHVKQYFYNQIKESSGWALCTVILDKRALAKTLINKPDPKKLYNALAREILEHVTFHGNLVRVELVVDKCKNDRDILVFNEYLSNHLAVCLPLHAKLMIDHVDSVTNSCLQAVDLFSWGIYRKYEKSDLKWYNVYCERIFAEKIM